MNEDKNFHPTVVLPDRTYPVQNSNKTFESTENLENNSSETIGTTVGKSVVEHENMEFEQDSNSSFSSYELFDSVDEKGLMASLMKFDSKISNNQCFKNLKP